MRDGNSPPPRPITRLHHGEPLDAWDDDFAGDPLHDPRWSDPRGPGGWYATDYLDDRPEWDTDRRCIGVSDVIGYERLNCPNDATDSDGLCDSCRERQWQYLCTHCGLNPPSYRDVGRPPVLTCRTCYQWLRRNHSKYAPGELNAAFAKAIARRRARAGRSPSPER